MTPPFAIDNTLSSHLVSILCLGPLGLKDNALSTAANLGDLQRLFHRSAMIDSAIIFNS